MNGVRWASVPPYFENDTHQNIQANKLKQEIRSTVVEWQTHRHKYTQIISKDDSHDDAHLPAYCLYAMCNKQANKCQHQPTWIFCSRFIFSLSLCFAHLWLDFFSIALGRLLIWIHCVNNMELPCTIYFFFFFGFYCVMHTARAQMKVSKWKSDTVNMM